MAARDLTNNYRYSFSGADARAFAYFPGFAENTVPFESLHTISVSVHEAKGQVRALGHRGIKGMARGVRTIAGSMIFTVIENNPLADLQNALFLAHNLESNHLPAGWSIDQNSVGTGTAFDGSQFYNRIAPLIPPFNLIIHYVSEGARHSTGIGRNPNEGSLNCEVASAALMLKGIEFIDEGVVTSVNDIVTEVTMSFIAMDYKPLSRNDFTLKTFFNFEEDFSLETRRLQEEV